MKLDLEEAAMLKGSVGAALQEAMTQQMNVGQFFSASQMVPIRNAHFTGDFEVMGNAGIVFLDSLVREGARVKIPTSRNSTCCDLVAAAYLGQRSELVEGELQVSSLLRQLGVIAVNTCIGYQTVYTPHFGEHVAWGDTGAVTYGNGVLGARSNYEAGPASLFAGLTGRTPAYGYHLDEHRRGNVVCRVDAALNDVADWGVIGALVGTRFRGYWNVPVFDLAQNRASPDQLKHLSASLASYGSMAMFHVAGVTPECPTVDSAIDKRRVLGEMIVTQAEIERVYKKDIDGPIAVDVVVFSAPQLSLLELRQITCLIEGRGVHADVDVFVTTNSMVAAAAENEGLLAVLRKAGVMVLSGTCWYLLDLNTMCSRYRWQTIVTNSAKLVNIMRNYDINPMLRRTDVCVEAAVLGWV